MRLSGLRSSRSTSTPIPTHAPPPPGRGALGRQGSRALAGSALVFAAWACQDSTGPAAAPGDGAAPRLGQTFAYHCSVAATTPAGVQEGLVPLHFPAEARSADGSTMDYRYRRQTPSGATTYSADCVIPRTMSAVEMMNRRFRVPADQRSPRGRNPDGAEFTTQGCVREGECALEPIVVVGAPGDEHCERALDGSCQSDGGEEPTNPPSPPGSGGGGGGGGDGDGGAAETNTDLPEKDLQQLNCANPGSAQEKAFCIRQIAFAGTVRHQRTKDAIERIRNRGGVCVEIAAKASAYLDAGQIGFYPIESGMAGGYGVGAHGLALQDRWADVFYDTPESSGRTLDWVIAHEVEHTMGQFAHSYTDALGVDHTADDNLCSAR